MNKLININYDSDRPTVLGRELHEKLRIKTVYPNWFNRMCEYGFEDGKDYMTVSKNVIRADGTKMPQMQAEHQLTVDMAKQICMIQRTDIGRQFREYFIAVEEQWNSPDAIMQRALTIANARVEKLRGENAKLLAQAEEDKPKVLFADAVSASETDILVGELAKLLRQNGVDIGQNRLFGWLRKNGYLGNRGSHYNIPTQRAMDMGPFRIKETTVVHSDGHTSINRTAKVSGKGQQYFVNLFLNGQKHQAT